MRTTLAVMGLLASVACAQDYPDVQVSDFTEKTFKQLVDHTNYQDDRTFDMRYWINDQYFDEEEGPVFLYICGEYRCSVPETRLFPFMVGGKQSARLLVLEHRYYGDSQPFDEWTTENLSYLNSEQALADIAYFLGSMNVDKPDRNTIVVGGSYPGAMSAWFRNRYPHVAMASWASSGVVQPINDFWQFDEQVYLSSVKSGDWCPALIQQSTAYVDEQSVLYNQGKTNEITSVLPTECEGMRTDDFMFYYADIFVESVQYGHRTALCEMLWDAKDESQASIFHKVVNFGATVPGVNPPDYDTNILSQTTVDVNSAGRPWTYQYCTEFGFYQVPSHEHVMRSHQLDYSYWPEMCERVFKGWKGEAKAWQTAVDLGGFNIQGTNTFFTNGNEDPWKWATQREDRPSLNQVSREANCNDCGHCGELYTPSESDPKELQDIRAEIDAWINDLLHGDEKSSFFLQ